MTERLWLQEPARRTCLAKVMARRGRGFVLDRSLFCPGQAGDRHPQPPDRGEVWLGGDKRWLQRVLWDRGELVHLLDGAVPDRGAAVRCHLDVPRREATEDAHTAMHLVLSALARARGIVLTGPARVQGGRQFTLAARPGSFDPAGLAEALAQANAAAARRLPVEIVHAPGDALHQVDPQPFADGATHPGGGPTLRILRIGDASALPCEGTLRTTTAGLGRIVLARAAPGPEGAVLQFRVAPPGRVA